MNDNHARLSPALVETIAGLAAGTISTLAVHPLDVIKTRLQSTSPPQPLSTNTNFPSPTQYFLHAGQGFWNSPILGNQRTTDPELIPRPNAKSRGERKQLGHIFLLQIHNRRTAPPLSQPYPRNELPEQ